MTKQTVTLIKGDGIGPEISIAVQQIFAAAETPVLWEEAEAGLNCIERYGNGLPQETLDSIVRNGAALKAPTTTPIGGGHKSINVTIRKSLDLFANVRPSKSLPGISTRFDNVDLIIVRENVEDTYGGIEHQQTPDVAQCLRLITRPGSLNAARYAFEMARVAGRRKVTCVHKANIQKMTDGLFLRSFREVAVEYPDIEASDILIDNLCMQLVSRPEQFDVLLLPNLFGDIVSDLCAGLVGGLGVAPGGNIGRNAAVFEAVHGSAPDIAGKGLANPTAFLLSGIQMLSYLGLNSYALRIQYALEKTLKAGIKTRDLGGNSSTQQFTEAVIKNMPHLPQALEASQDVEKPARIIIPVPESHFRNAEWEIVGIDVFTRSDNGLPELPEKIGKFRLTTLSNRGTKVYPGPKPDILMVDCYTSRWIADTAVEHNDIVNFLREFPAAYPWTHIEVLYREGDTPMYSKMQGE
ncbi:MAG: NAD-dependent isocitrate dehydrogenase [Bacteroidetes bacterium]|nr:NAD-dependent isocitrate dehydrogenase [Bacteroidota bacterium]